MAEVKFDLQEEDEEDDEVKAPSTAGLNRRTSTRMYMERSGTVVASLVADPSVASCGLTESDIHKLQDIFETFDMQRTGILDVEMLVAAIKHGTEDTNTIGAGSSFSVLEKELQNGTKTLTFEEFVQKMAPLLQQKDGEHDMKRVFRIFDVDNTGAITADNLAVLARQLGIVADPSELEDMIAHADINSQGEITYEHFRQIFMRD
mmetsp:Transcript_45228/g.98128  ORF Transcript_45228/g.98128 Transcript_45228/m.98128 type:complete len:205 (-) Transcript_45228:30-644(-)|eukprot:CAMPEP_0204274370 /NCGR_PEP_ID=MMETSP0468-20130131/25151_1 /ASSEMBLY_ACC=CAM_ASM_000383 /TAXON_ID=2969 /ORGANISM="Oxyrrhis marina" /LENGTH=204 /DNA_ID=CAMNT_0051250569 /DNA_START=25 /DNA_END=639 /DNA_ORIENTATION=-